MASNQGTDTGSTDTGRNVTELHEHQRTFRGFVHFLAWLFGLSLAAIVFAGLVNA